MGLYRELRDVGWGRSDWPSPGGHPLRGDQEKGRSELLGELRELRQEFNEQLAELRDAERRYGALIGNSSDLIFEFDSDGRLIFLSPNCSSLISRPLDEILGKTLRESGVLESLHPEDRKPLFDAFREGFKSNRDTMNRFRLRDHDGSWRCFEGVSTPCKQADGSRRLLSICRDVTDVVQARQDHQETEELYRIVTDVSRDMIIEVDAAGKLVFANRSVEDITGYTNPDLLGKEYISFFDLVHPDDRERIIRQYEKQKGEPGTTVHYPPYRFRHKDGSWIWFSTIGTWYESANGEVRMIEVSRDISQEIQREEERIEIARQMLETQKLESLGVMAGGITHDFNNLLTPILGDAQLALLDLPPDSPVRPHIEQIYHAAKRAAALTRQMLAYSGQTPVSVEPISVSRLVEEMGQLLEGTVSGKAALIFDLSDDLPAVEADVAQLSQVLMNLITNATEAVREGAGRITLRTGAVEAEKIDRSSVVGDCEPAVGAYVFFEVIDDGCGMDADTQSKIFDPFFTTKFTGRGLGLAAVVGIVRSHGGMIEIDSAVGRGTRFRVLFPAARQTAAVVRPRTQPPVEEWRASGTVLVVDDDDGVRELLDATLRRAGFTVLVASDGREGVDLFRLHADEICAVVLDRTMPDIGGEDAFDEIRRIRPGVRIMLISGYSEERAAWHFIDKGLDAFMHKPFEPSVFLEKIRRIVESDWDPNA